ncbi:MAG TPA: Uma2 family endonuclease [Thermoanaerobaculia bacterium]|nr:Uma2 family endonuclease [Thermoanaerobaculia bacterium]
MSVQTKARLSPQEYLDIERRAETKSEYLDGAMFAMTGVSRRHSLVTTNLTRELSQRLLDRPCEVHSSDLRVYIPATGLYTYPDLAVVCGEPQFEDDQELDTLLNPTLIVEVLSPTTEAYDRGKKFEHYDSIGSLAEYVLVSQTTPRVEQLVRQEGGHWLFTGTSGLDGKVILSSIGCELELAKIYHKVPFISPKG